MKPLFINFTDHEGTITKTFSTVSVKTGMMDKIFDIAERAEGIKGETDLKEIRDFFKELKATIVAIFGGQFTYDELNEGAEQDEVMEVFSRLVSRISGGMQKN